MKNLLCELQAAAKRERELEAREDGGCELCNDAGQCEHDPRPTFEMYQGVEVYFQD